MQRNGGWSLVELLTIVVIMGAVMALFGPVFNAAFRDLPRAKRAMEGNSRICDMLLRMREDIDAAEALPAPAENTLWIRLPDSQVRYTFEDGEVTRRVSDLQRQADLSPAISWQTPRADIHWRLWERDGRHYAVEVATSVSVTVNGRAVKKLANSHVFFLNAAPKGRRK